MKQNATPEEVNRAVALDLRSRRISQAEAGKIIGKARTQLSNQFCSKRYFSKSMASLFERAFGYNIQYLLFGEGDLKTKETIHDVVSMYSKGDDHTEDVSVLSALVAIAEDIIIKTGNKDALDAWKAISTGDFNGYVEGMQRISGNAGSNNAILARYVASRIDLNAFMVIREKTE